MQTLNAKENRVAHTRHLLCTAANGEVGLALANASVYLDMAGRIVVAWIWLRQALVAAARLPGAQGSERDFYEGKLAACACFFRRELPPTLQNELLNNLDRTCLGKQDAWF
jgi:hypothetical protein